MDPNAIQHASIAAMVGWFILGLLFVYMEIWFKPEVDESISGPYKYAKLHFRAVVFSVVSFIGLYAMWMSVGLHLNVNGEDIINLPARTPNAMVCLIGYSASALFSGIASKYQKVRNTDYSGGTPPTDGGK